MSIVEAGLTRAVDTIETVANAVANQVPGNVSRLKDPGTNPCLRAVSGAIAVTEIVVGFNLVVTGLVVDIARNRLKGSEESPPQPPGQPVGRRKA